jgi:excisionase family DNA binding protein
MHNLTHSAASVSVNDPPPRVADVEGQIFLTAAEASKIFRLDESTLYRHLRNGIFPGVKIGGRYVVPRAVVERLISDVLATGRCVELSVWTERWRAVHRAAIERLTGEVSDGAT